MKEQGKSVGATIPGNMGTAFNNQFGGGVGIPGQGAIQDQQREMLRRAMMHMQQGNQYAQQGAQRRQQMIGMPGVGSQGLQNAWANMGDPNQFIQEQAQKQALLRAYQNKIKQEMQAKALENPSAKNTVNDGQAKGGLDEYLRSVGHY